MVSWLEHFQIYCDVPFLQNYGYAYAHTHTQTHIGSLCGVVGNTLDHDIIVSQFKLQLYYHLYFQINTLEKGMNSLIPPQIWVK